MTWFTVRCVFRHPSASGAAVYEERLTVWKARTFDEAIGLAENDAAEYIEGLDGEYVGLAQAYALPDPPGPGAEVFSLMRESDLDAAEYISRFFDTGQERQIDLEEDDRGDPRHYAIEWEAPPMSDAQIVTQYAEHCRTTEVVTDAHDPRRIAWAAMWQATRDDPNRALQLIMQVADRLGPDDSDALGFLGADALEDVLFSHGDELIDAVESEASSDPAFRQALESVHLPTQPIGRRVTAFLATLPRRS